MVEMHSDKNPLVTVGVTTYDRAEMLVETVRSVLGQSHHNLEILVANDNPDKILTIRDLDVVEDQRITIINHKVNLGEINNLNWLLLNSSGKYFTWLADDDVIHPQHIELLLSVISDQLRISAAFSGFTSDDLKFLECIDTDLLSSEFNVFDSESFLLEYSKRNISIIGCYGLFERISLLSAGGFRQLGNGFSPYSDTLIPIKLFRYGQVAVTDSISVFFRAHASSMSNSLTDLKAYLSAEEDFLQEINNETLNVPTPMRTQIFQNFGMWFSDNHLSLISRVPGKGVFADSATWFKVNNSNQRNLSKFGYKVRKSFFRGLIVLVRHRIIERQSFKH